MSKLFNTLEKIRASEQAVATGNDSAPAAATPGRAGIKGRGRFIFLGISAALLLAIFLFYAGAERKKASRKTTRNAEVTAGLAAPTAIEQAPGAAVPPVAPQPLASGSYQQLNDAGLELIKDNKPWPGIYLLEQARKQQPERPEALINMAVALAELGLSAPAQRLFREAHALAPNHPMLRKNLALLGQADLLDKQWPSSSNAKITSRGKNLP